MTCSEYPIFECRPTRNRHHRHSLPCGVRLGPLSLQDLSTNDTNSGRRTRNFVSTPQGRVINRGDSLRIPSNVEALELSRLDYKLVTPRQYLNRNDRAGSRHSRAVTVAPKPNSQPEPVPTSTIAPPPLYRVLVLGAAAVGKSSLINQFQSSSELQDVDCTQVLELLRASTSVTVNLDDKETELHITEKTYPADVAEEVLLSSELSGFNALLLVYSVSDYSSFGCIQRACGPLCCSNIPPLPVILVANKCDLVRSRQVSFKEGRCCAVEYGFKYVETSVVISSNVDQLLAGIAAQAHLFGQSHKRSAAKSTYQLAQRRSRNRRGVKSRTLPSTVLRDVFLKFIGVGESKSCQNLLIL